MKVFPGYFLIIVTDCWGLRGRTLPQLSPPKQWGEATGAAGGGMAYFSSGKAGLH